MESELIEFNTSIYITNVFFSPVICELFMPAMLKYPNPRSELSFPSDERIIRRVFSRARRIIRQDRARAIIAAAMTLPISPKHFFILT